jgi:hypothetical protein
MLALLHAAPFQEARLLMLTEIDRIRCSVRLGERPHSVPLDPASWTVLLRCPEPDRSLPPTGFKPTSRTLSNTAPPGSDRVSRPLRLTEP